MKKSHINNHYIQKSFAKSWSDENGNIKYIFDGEIERKKFNINDLNKNQPISKKEFYSKEIEIGMNEIESDGIKVIKKIINSNNNSLTLYRYELISLKFYLYLSGIRTDKFRENIRNKTGDSLFNKIMNEEKREEKEIQEKYISKTIEFYREFKNNNLDEYIKIYEKNFQQNLDFFSSIERELKKEDIKRYEWEMASLENFIFCGINNFLKESRLIFVKFNTNSLVLSDANSFCEYYPDNEKFYNQKIYNFFPISPSIGVIIFNNYSSISNPNYDSKIFENSLKNSVSINRYKNEEKINHEINKMLKEILNDNNFNNLNVNIKQMMLMNIKQHICQKYKNNLDEYNYKFILEKEYVAIFCNAMMLVHNKNNIIIYKKFKDVARAKKIIKLGLVYRMEDTI